MNDEPTFADIEAIRQITKDKLDRYKDIILSECKDMSSLQARHIAYRLLHESIIIEAERLTR